MEFTVGLAVGAVVGFIWGWNLYHRRAVRRLFTLLQHHDFPTAAAKALGK